MNIMKIIEWFLIAILSSLWVLAGGGVGTTILDIAPTVGKVPVILIACFVMGAAACGIGFLLMQTLSDDE